MSDFKFALILAAIVLGSIIITDDMTYQTPEKIIKQRAIQQEMECTRIKPGYTDCKIISTREYRL